MNGNTQLEKILSHLLEGHSITHLSAIKYFGTMRLSAHIYTLRKMGYRIQRTNKKDEQGARYASYKLVQ